MLHAIEVFEMRLHIKYISGSTSFLYAIHEADMNGYYYVVAHELWIPNGAVNDGYYYFTLQQAASESSPGEWSQV